ncbi:MAG: hypothetical protein DI589_04375 [Shinella sp.]|jgi:hypothetical protein|nr:MAG: hypothetical protein DI589_04375 [Shinella sp.]
MTIFDPILDFFRGKAVTVPPLDGAFRPNRRLDEATIAGTIASPVDLAVYHGALVVASGNAVHRLESGGSFAVHAIFPAPVSALAVSTDGRLAVALETGALSVDGQAIALPDDIRSITALAFSPDGTLFLANGSQKNAPCAWKRDLMEKQASGSLWRVGSESARKVAGGLAWPQGIAFAGGRLIASESWTRRLVAIDPDTGAISTALANIPGYPGRITPLSGGGFALSVFAPVNRLIEFVLQEDTYRTDMLREVDPACWIAPMLSSGRSFLEPLQCGGIKTMGIHKPWAPSLSYGLVARLDASLHPVDSYHSRADGNRHGIFGAAEKDGHLYAISAGGDVLLDLGEGQTA